MPFGRGALADFRVLLDDFLASCLAVKDERHSARLTMPFDVTGAIFFLLSFCFGVLDCRRLFPLPLGGDFLAGGGDCVRAFFFAGRFWLFLGVDVPIGCFFVCALVSRHSGAWS